jgi:hypothetical protein
MDSNFTQFHYHLILHQGPSKFYLIYNDYNLIVFDGLLNNNEIALNLNYHQSISGRIYSYDFFYFKDFFRIYLKIYC